MSRRRQSRARPEELRRARRIGRSLSPWYERNGRHFPWRAWTDTFRLTVVEVLLQRTKAEHVERHVGTFFAKYRNWQSLAGTRPIELEADLAPLGLHRRRSKSLVALAQAMSGEDAAGDHLPGLGQYITRAVAVASSNAPEAMVDSNFVRIIRRAFGGEWMSDYRYDRRLQELAAEVIRASENPRAANWAILDLGAGVCRPRSPRCPECPIAKFCLTGLVQGA